jgi:hypothetical protein
MVSSPLSRSSSTPFSGYRERLFVHPTEWTVNETVSWLRSKGFEEDVCEKFIEQETAGDALLNLDASSLKTEIGIIPYGKRFRIANAIDELRRVANVKFPSVKQHTWPRPAPHESLKPLLLRSVSLGNILNPPPRSTSGNWAKAPMMPPERESDPDVRSTVEEPTESCAKTRAQHCVSPPLPFRGGPGKTVVSVYFWCPGCK